MSKTVRISFVILLSVSLLISLSCASPQTSKIPSSIELTDQLGRVVKLDKIPEKIVSLAPSNTEILFALGLSDRIVGVTDYCNYPLEAKQKSRIGGFSTPNIEKIVSVSPDLVLAAPINESRIIPQLESKGLAVFALAPKTLNEVLDAITLVGRITRKEKEASALVAGMQDKIKAVKEKTDGLSQAQKPRVFYVIWHEPLMSAGSGTFQDELIRTAGGVNIAGSLSGYPGFTLEAVIEANPEVAIAGVGMGTGADSSLEFLKTETRLKDISARLNNRVYGIDVDLVGRAGPRITDALEQFARFMHPELFPEPNK